MKHDSQNLLNDLPHESWDETDNNLFLILINCEILPPYKRPKILLKIQIYLHKITQKRRKRKFLKLINAVVIKTTTTWCERQTNYVIRFLKKAVKKMRKKAITSWKTLIKLLITIYMSNKKKKEIFKILIYTLTALNALEVINYHVVMSDMWDHPKDPFVFGRVFCKCVCVNVRHVERVLEMWIDFYEDFCVV